MKNINIYTAGGKWNEIDFYSLKEKVSKKVHKKMMIVDDDEYNTRAMKENESGDDGGGLWWWSESMWFYWMKYSLDVCLKLYIHS